MMEKYFSFEVLTLTAGIDTREALKKKVRGNEK